MEDRSCDISSHRIKWLRNNIDTPMQQGRLAPNRAEHLEKIGFHRIVHEVGTRNQMFMETFRNLKSHVLINGWGNWQGRDSLKSFSGSQRKNLAHRRGEEKIQWKVDLLDSIGYPWCV